MTPLAFTYTTVAGDTQATVARELADLINAQGLPEFRASSDGEVLRIENIAGNVFTTVFESSTQYEEIGQPQTGEVWSVTLETATSGPLVFSTTAAAGATQATLASALAASSTLRRCSRRAAWTAC